MSTCFPIKSNNKHQTSNSLSRGGATVELSNDHGVADAHENDWDEEHDEVYDKIVDFLDKLFMDDCVGDQITVWIGWEYFIARSLY